MELCATKSSELLTFRFFADFDIQVRADEMNGLGPEQHTMLLAILRSSAIRRRVAQLALETDLSEITGCHLTDLFQGPSIEEILDLVLSCLDAKDKPYWEGLRAQDGDPLHNQIMPVFLAFNITLRRAGIEELSGTMTEPIRKTVGPTMDATGL